MNTIALKRATDFLSSWLPYRFSQTSLPGLSVAVSCGEKVVFAQHHGRAVLDQPEPLNSKHLFGVASQSKMFSAVAVMQLCEQGVLSLDTPAYRYVSWLSKHPQAWAKEITVRQLLAHSAGLARELPNSDYWTLGRPFPGRAELQRALLETPVVIEPNTQLKYSNAGYALLGQVIEAVSGQAYAHYVKQHIVEKLGLSNTFTDYGEVIASRTVTGYSLPFAGVRMPLAYRQPANAMASVAGMHATCEDMCLFAAALCRNNSLLSDASKKELQRTQWAQTDGYDAGIEFGMGFEVMSAAGRRIVGHSGHIGGHVTATFFDPECGLAVAVMANSKDAPSPRIASGIFEILGFFADNAVLPTPKELARLNVRLFSPIAAIEIVATPGKIIAIDPDDWQPFAFREELEAINETSLRIITPGSIFNKSEMVYYSFKNNKVIAATYAGGTLLPEHIYKTKMLQQ